MKSLQLGLLLFLAGWVIAQDRLKEEFAWTRITYVWPPKTESRFGYGYYRPRPTKATKPVKGGSSSFVFPDSMPQSSQTTNNQVPDNVNYIYENNIPMGANVWKNKLFITVPRRRDGVPSSLNYVDMSKPDRMNVPLIPYPNWDVNRLDYEGSDRIVSVYRIGIDPCDRAWMADTGVIEVIGNATRVQPAAILAIDLNTDKIIKRFVLPQNTVLPNTALANLVVDVTADTCDDAYIYIPDLSGYGLIVYSLKKNDAWRVSHNYFYLEPNRGEFNIGGNKFQWNDGIFSAALSEKQSDGFRTLYFHAMAGTNIYSVSTKILRNKSLATRSYHENDFKVLGDRGELQQTSASALHQPTGVLFLGLVNQNALGCWNTKKPSKKDNFVVLQRDDKKMIYPCDIKIAGDNVVLLTNGMPIFLYGRLNYDEVNFRVWINDAKEVVKDTNCAL